MHPGQLGVAQVCEVALLLIPKLGDWLGNETKPEEGEPPFLITACMSRVHEIDKT